MSRWNRQSIQLLIIPVAFTFCGFIGIAVTNAGQSLYGEVLWDPLTLIDKWDNRAAAFFAAFAFCLATIGTNISANSLCAGNDMTALYPKVRSLYLVRRLFKTIAYRSFTQYINIRRGQVICAIIGGWALCPWEILARFVNSVLFMK